MVTSSAPLTVGVLFSETGVTSVLERTQRQAVLLAVDEINAAGGVLGREVCAVAPDPGSDPRRFRREATQLLDSGIETIFGCYMSSTRRAVLPVIERRDALLFYPTLYEGFEFSPNCVYSGAAPNQNSSGLADYVTENCGDRYYFVGSNYVFPYESNRIMRDLLQNYGAKIVEERYLPMEPSAEEIADVIKDIARRAPVVVFSTIVGDGATAFYRAFDAAGFDRSQMPIASLTIGEPELQAMGPSAAIGHITSAPYFSCIQSPANQRFVTSYRAKFGANAPMSACTEAAYFQVHLFAEAAKRAEAADRRSILAALPGIVFDAPQGAVRVDARTHHTHLWPRVARIDSRGEFEILRESAVPVRPDPYLVDPGSVAWGRGVVAQ